jgi:hypothetical protein
MDSSNPMSYKERLTPWAIAHLLPDMQRIIVGRFRHRSDADGHMQFLRRQNPTASFVVVFDSKPEIQEE